MSKTPPSRGKSGRQVCGREEEAPKSHIWGSSASLRTHALGLLPSPSTCPPQNPPCGGTHGGEHGSAVPWLLLRRAQVLNPTQLVFGEPIAYFFGGMCIIFGGAHGFGESSVGSGVAFLPWLTAFSTARRIWGPPSAAAREEAEWDQAGGCREPRGSREVPTGAGSPQHPVPAAPSPLPTGG